MAHVVIDLGGFRNDVGRGAAVGNDVVNAAVGWHVLAHQIDHEVHRFDTIQGGSASFGCRRSMGSDAVKRETGGFVGGAAGGRRIIAAARMPVEHNIHIIKCPGPGEVHLARSTFFGGCAIDADGASSTGCFEPAGNSCSG